MPLQEGNGSRTISKTTFNAKYYFTPMDPNKPEFSQFLELQANKIVFEIRHSSVIACQRGLHSRFLTNKKKEISVQCLVKLSLLHSYYPSQIRDGQRLTAKTAFGVMGV